MTNQAARESLVAVMARGRQAQIQTSTNRGLRLKHGRKIKKVAGSGNEARDRSFSFSVARETRREDFQDAP
jgi:hypothetical protein